MTPTSHHRLRRGSLRGEVGSGHLERGTPEGDDPARGSPHYLSAQPAALRAWLRERLPEYMVPSSFIALEELPLTANGKVDRRALLALDVPQIASEKDIVEPGTETEIAVAEMWRGLLRVDHVSVDDNFFEAGGHSLLATRLMSQVTKRFDVEITLRSFFADPTIAGVRPSPKTRTISPVTDWFV